MPGAKRPNKAELIKRKTKLAIRVKAVKFSPDGSQFACATTEGLIIYSIANDLLMESNFQPFDIDETITIDNIIQNIKIENYLSALVMALKMNELEVISKVY